MNKQIIAKTGLNFVRQRLLSQDWHIIKQNWHLRKLEIDLIAYHPQTQVLLIIEVKTRYQQQSYLAYSYQQQHRIRHLLPKVNDITPKSVKQLRRAVAQVTLFPRKCIQWYFEQL